MAIAPRTIRVELLERGYDIEIGQGNLAAAGSFVAARLPCQHAVVITDEHVLAPHGALVAEALRAAGIRVDLVVAPPGENSKSIAQAAELWNRMLQLAADRQTVVVAVGGGVVGDLGGFVAATYLRGIPFIQIPTTLMAQVDSSVGGKVGINLPLGKNLVGAFWQPAGVLIDTGTLATLPDREYRSGLAEVVKYGVILDEPFFAWLENRVAEILARDPDGVAHLIARCCELKARVVKEDEREETGLRAVLNYGHTFCHAIETVAGYGVYLHGEAVSIGMVCASRLACALGRVPAEFVQRQRRLLLAFGLPVEVANLNSHDLLAAMQRDKKAAHGKLRFVLPSRFGHVELVGDVDASQVLAALRN